MKGRNKFILNEGTMQQALEHYFNATQLNSKNKIKVVSVKENKDNTCPCFTVETESSDEEQ